MESRNEAIANNGNGAKTAVQIIMVIYIPKIVLGYKFGIGIQK